MTLQDLRPGRLRDQSYYSAFYAVLTWLLLAAALLSASSYHFRGPKIYRKLSRRFESLLRPSDWAWILGAGTLLPLGLWLAAVFLTPIGGRGASQPGHFFATPLLNAELLAGLMLVSPALFVRWRLGIRGRALGFPKRPPWLWFCLFCLSALIAGLSIIPDPAGSICACGHVDWLELFHWQTFTSISLLPPVVWLAITSGRALFSSAHALPYRMTTARSLVTGYAFGMLCMVGTAFGFLASFEHWSNRNPMLRLSTEKPSLTPYEYDVTRQLQTELRELWK